MLPPLGPILPFFALRTRISSTSSSPVSPEEYIYHNYRTKVNPLWKKWVFLPPILFLFVCGKTGDSQKFAKRIGQSKSFMTWTAWTRAFRSHRFNYPLPKLWYREIIRDRQNLWLPIGMYNTGQAKFEAHHVWICTDVSRVPGNRYSYRDKRLWCNTSPAPSSPHVYNFAPRFCVGYGGY